MSKFLETFFLSVLFLIFGGLSLAAESGGKIESGQTIRLPNGKKIVIKINQEGRSGVLNFGEIKKEDRSAEEKLEEGAASSHSEHKEAYPKTSADDEKKETLQTDDYKNKESAEEIKPSREEETQASDSSHSEESLPSAQQKFQSSDEKAKSLGGELLPEGENPSIWDVVSAAALEEFKKASSQYRVNAEFYYAQTACFFIVSDNHDASLVCRDIALECENMLAHYFSGRNEKYRFPRLIVVQAISPEKLLEENPDFKGKFSVSTDESGDISIVVKWNSELSLGEFCSLVSGAALRRICMDYHSVENSKNIPYFLDMAFAAELERRVRPSYLQDLARESLDEKIPTLKETMRLTRMEGKDVRAASNAYWALKALEKIAPSREAFTAFMRASLLSSNIDSLCDGAEKNWGVELPNSREIRNSNGEFSAETSNESQKSSGENFSSKAQNFTDTFYLYWACVVMGEKISRLGGVQTMKDSRMEILRLAAVQISDEDGNRRGVLDFSEMWELRDEETMREAVRLRIVEVKVALSLANPIYYNSLLALGKIFEDIQNGDSSAFKISVEDFRRECVQSFSLEKRVGELMNDDSGALNSLRSKSEPQEN